MTDKKLDEAKANLATAKADLERDEVYNGRSHSCVYRRRLEAEELVRFYERIATEREQTAQAKHRKEDA